MTRDDALLQTSLRTLNVVEALYELGNAGVTDVAEHAGIDKSSAHAHLQTLHEAEYVCRNGTEYRLSLRFLNTGGSIRSRMPIFDTAEQKVNALAWETGEIVSLVVEEFGWGIFLHCVEGAGAATATLFTGSRTYLHTTAEGKAIMANLDDDLVDEILESHGLPSSIWKGTDTITDRGQLEEELETVREQGYAIEDEERHAGIRAVGVPLKKADGDVIGSIGITGPVGRLSDEKLYDEYPRRLQQTANLIELDLTHS